MPVEADNLDLAVHTFGYCQDCLIEGAAGNGKFFMDSTEKFKTHGLIRVIMLTRSLMIETGPHPLLSCSLWVNSFSPATSPCAFHSRSWLTGSGAEGTCKVKNQDWEEI